MLLVDEADLDIVERAVPKLLAHAIEGVLELLLEALRIRPAIGRTCGGHGGGPFGAPRMQAGWWNSTKIEDGLLGTRGGGV